MSTRNFELRSVTDENEFTEPLLIERGGIASISISGTFVANVEMQRKLDGANWRTVKRWSDEIETSYYADEGCELRLGVPTGDFTSGTAVCRLGV